MLAQAKKLTNSKFVRNVAIVATGTAGAQAITMAFAPIITRLYGPEAFGLLGTFMAILAIATPIAALTYPIAIVLPKSDTDAVGLAKLSAGLAFVMASLLTILILFIGDGLAALLNLQSIAGFLLLIPVAMLFSAFHQILQQWLIRKKQFKITARVAFLQALTLNSAKAGIGWFHPVGAVLIILATAGNALHAFLLWLGIRKQPVALPEKIVNEQSAGIKELAKRHRDFPIFQMPQVFLNAASQSVPVILLASYYGASVAGFYTLAKTVIMLPSALISKSVGDVIFPKLSEAHNEGVSGRPYLIKATSGLFVVGLLPMIVLWFFGEDLFAFIFGSDWAAAGVFAAWLSIWVLFSFSNPPSVKAVIVYRKQNYALVLNMVSFLLRVAGIYIGYNVFGDPVASVILFVVAGVFHNVVFIFIAYNFSGGRNVRNV